ncbi:MAG: hypothetical protein V7739_05245 [Motiliproteus sp.]
MPEKKAIARLEALVEIDKKVSHALSELDKGREDLREAKSQLKALKSLDPERLKKSLAELKKKMVVKNTEIKKQSTELASLRKKLRDAKSELSTSKNETDAFYVSACKQWELSYTGFQYPDERAADNSSRIRCLNRESGSSVIANGLDGDKAVWSNDIGIPDEVSVTAAERIAELNLSTSSI